MAVNLSPVGGVAAQFFTNTGAVLTGGKLFTYAAGTTTPAVAYTSSNGLTAWTNPIVLDAAGRVSGSGEIWLTDGINYKFVLKDSNDVLIATYDNVSGINSNFVAYTNSQEIQTATSGQTVFTLATMQYQVGTNSLSVFVDGVNQYGPGASYAYTETSSTSVTFVSGLHVGAEVKFTSTQQQGAGAVDASQVSYTPAGTGAVTTNVQAKLRQYVSVMDFGAVGNGVANDTAAIQAAITASDSVYFPPGNYLITSAISIPANRNIYGDNLCKILAGANNITMFDTSSAFVSSLIISNLNFANAGSFTGVTGINITNGNIDVALDQVGFVEINTGVYLDTNYSTRLTFLTSYKVPNPVVILNGNLTQVIYPNFDNIISHGGTGAGTAIANTGTANHLSVIGGYIQGFEYGITDTAYNSTVEKVYFEQITEAALNYSGATYPKATNNFLFGLDSKTFIKCRNVNRGYFKDNLMATSNATGGIYDVNASNQDCYGSLDYVSATYNNLFGSYVGLLPLGAQENQCKDNVFNVKQIPAGVTTGLFNIQVSDYSVVTCELDLNAIENTAYFASVSKKYVFTITKDTASTNSSVVNVAAFDVVRSNANYSVVPTVSLSLNGSGQTVVSVNIPTGGALGFSVSTCSATLMVRSTGTQIVVRKE